MLTFCAVGEEEAATCTGESVRPVDDDITKVETISRAQASDAMIEVRDVIPETITGSTSDSHTIADRDGIEDDGDIQESHICGAGGGDVSSEA